MHDLSLLPAQYDLLESQAPVAALIAGIGFGKSFTLACYVLSQISKYPKAKGLIVANTYTQLQNATIPAIVALLDNLGIQYKLTLGGAKKHLQIGETTIFIYSLEQPNLIRGIEVGWLVGDEVAFASKEGIDVIFGRLRDKKGSLQARFFTSPNGYNFFYDFCQSTKVEIHRGRTSDNYHLPEAYYKQLLELYGGETSPLAKQELFGEFVNQTSNSVYYAFSRAKHLAPVAENVNLPVYIGCDFNAGNMSATAIQYDSTGFKVLKEIKLKDAHANTFSMAREIQSLYGNRAIIIPDSTANSRKTSAEAGVTDLTILRGAGLEVKHTRNPLIKDRHNEVNLTFHKNRIIIDSSCTELVKELETLGVDQDEGNHSHLAVTLGYVIHFLEPLKAPAKPSQQFNSPLVDRR